MAATIARSPLDEERFGIRTARANDVDVEDLASVLEFCRRERIAFLIARSDAGRVGAVQAMEGAGFRLMDTWLLYEGAIVTSDIDPAAGVRPMKPDEVEEVVGVARESFAGYSGHYHADPRIDPALANEIYIDWTRRCCAGEAAEVVLVVDRGLGIEGFSAFRFSEPDVGELVLGAVLPTRQGHGLYLLLTRAGMNWAGACSATRLQAATHLSNLAAQRTWARLGMSPVRAAYTLHRWFD